MNVGLNGHLMQFKAGFAPYESFVWEANKIGGMTL